MNDRKREEVIIIESENPDDGSKETKIKVKPSKSGATAGAAAGAAIGSVVPVVGTAVGALTGGLIGLIFGPAD